MAKRYWQVAWNTLTTQLQYVRDENRALHGSLGETRRQLRDAQDVIARQDETISALRIQVADKRLLHTQLSRVA